VVAVVLIAAAACIRASAPTTTLCIAKASTISKASDLEGQTVAVVSLVSLMSSGVKSWLTQNGADIAKIHLSSCRSRRCPLRYRAAHGRPQGGLSEPIMSGALAGGRQSPRQSIRCIANQFYIRIGLPHAHWLAKNQDAAKRFVGVIYDTARWANAHHDESAVILAKYTKLDVDRLKRMNRCIYATDLRPAMVQPVLDTAFKYKALETATSAAAMIAKGF